MSTTSASPASNTLLLRRQLTELTKHPVEGFSAGLVDENNLYEWDVMIIGFASLPLSLRSGLVFSFAGIIPMLTSDIRSKAPRILSSVYSCTPVIFHVLMSISSEGGFFKARLTFPPEFPLLPPKMRFITPMWHPNSAPLFSLFYILPRLTWNCRLVYSDGGVCISILHAPGDDQYGYEDAGERWMPVHTVESILLSVISLLSSEKPNLDSPANVDAAKEIRTDFPGTHRLFISLRPSHLTWPMPAYKKKVRRLVRRSADEAFD
ncbi:ubiquitin-conjugating enzyme [Lactarius akahatsu]|uniref:Ubiquitin-conjugating enzyme n=1 Tax=Lactarius akahatsu TaxID=416441 RepID=A0AAD4LHP8_9AGAM|nr:ubiquitin-conjugating enzyme [Lactarius akahatsu]